MARRGKVAVLLGPASSEDEAPEEVAFGAAREAAQAERKRVGEAARRHRELLKEKRRRRQELFAEQKKRKLLPEAVLQELAAAAPPAGPDEQAAAAERGKQSGGGAVKQRQGQVQRRVKKEKQGKGARSKGNYTAVRLKDQSFTGLHQQLALDFVKAQLYGPHANRAQANEFFSLENKKKPVKSAAVQFVDKSWGQEKKERAARFKKRWLAAHMKD
ncbi:nucleolar protein 7 [Falco naumanni]|uniref:nucleolar protein 7 n=1 Tax=Falco naumanni TaxID=148594 RepID=UPI001ADE23D8|nr:nucleolar protein 7 [Falco naumanni]